MDHECTLLGLDCVVSSTQEAIAAPEEGGTLRILTITAKSDMSGMAWTSFCREVRALAMDLGASVDITHELIQTEETKIRKGELR